MKGLASWVSLDGDGSTLIPQDLVSQFKFTNAYALKSTTKSRGKCINEQNTSNEYTRKP
jgi:hypothetical protein